MWLIVGAVPEDAFLLNKSGMEGQAIVKDNQLVLPDGCVFSVCRGTAALAATAILACSAMGAPLPALLLAGDCGSGEGSFKAYTWLADNVTSIAAKENLAGLTFHYLYPDLDGHNRLFSKLESLQPVPVLVADAGYMYAAKMSGYGSSYNVFTPDMGELAFLADEKAPHPFYTRGFLLAENEDAPKLVKRAWQHGNCPPVMIVKGQKDYITHNGEIWAEVSEPSCPAMECIGGTGDIVTGFVTAFLSMGCDPCKAAINSAKAARFLAEYCQPTPATQVGELIRVIPKMLEKYRWRMEE